MQDELVRSVGLLVAGAGSIVFALLAWRVWRGNRLEYDRNRRRTGSVMRAFRGEIPTMHDGTRDYRVSAGVAVDIDKNEWVEQGRLSTEAISAAIRRPSC